MRLPVLFLSILGLAASALSCSSSSSSGPSSDSVTQTIGPEGGIINVAGATVTFPPQALVLSREITITVTDAQAPTGYVMLSRLVKCEPSGIDFQHPVTMQIPYTDDGKPPTVFWTSAFQPALTDVGGKKSDDGLSVSADVEHFSEGFVGHKL